MLITEKRKQRWRRLEEFLQRIQKAKPASVSEERLRRLGVLYRQTSIDLSLLRSEEHSDPETEIYLNHLVSRAHSVIYSVRRGNIKSFWWFIRGGFASAVRRNLNYIGIAAAVFLLTGIVSFIAIKFNPKIAYSLFDEDVVQYEEYRLEHQKGEYKGNFTFSLPASSYVAAHIIANNVRVDIYSFASGILYCIPCLLILVTNGLMLGTFSGIIDNYGYTFDFFSLILTHGVWELTAMCFSAGAGLMLGAALIAPGEYSRRDALKLKAGEALQLFGGAVIMTVLTGFIEAYVTPHAPLSVRWVVIVLMTAFLVFYLTFAGRRTAAEPVNAQP